MFTKKQRVHIDNREAPTLLHDLIYNRITALNFSPEMTLIILCIGTDRSTGDSLGPLTGTHLKKMDYSPAIIVGDIEKPVHASNLDEIITDLHREYLNSFIVAIDAGLGKKSSVGYIEVKKGPLKPGTGVNKELTAIGNMHITGLVNVGGYMEYLVLQSTRLSLVMDMAQTIASALKKSISALYQQERYIE